MNKKIYKIVRFWSLIVFLVTIFCGLVYITVQQNYRQSANDPQIQMAEDTAAALKNGSITPYSFGNSDFIDISQSIAPFLTIYDAQSRSTSTNGTLDGNSPQLPQGVFAYTRQRGEERFTWQPKVGVRVAAILVSYQH